MSSLVSPASKKKIFPGLVMRTTLSATVSSSASAFAATALATKSHRRQRRDFTFKFIESLLIARQLALGQLFRMHRGFETSREVRA